MCFGKSYFKPTKSTSSEVWKQVFLGVSKPMSIVDGVKDRPWVEVSQGSLKKGIKKGFGRKKYEEHWPIEEHWPMEVPFPEENYEWFKANFVGVFKENEGTSSLQDKLVLEGFHSIKVIPLSGSLVLL